jgi:DNA-directed RNA polymerase
MPTPAQIDEQLEMERSAIACGLSRLTEMTDRLEDQTYASATVYGIYSIGVLVPKVSLLIEEARVKYRSGHNGRHFRAVAQHLDNLEPEAMANIALKVVFDNMFLPPAKKIKSGKSDSLLSFFKAIGKAIMAEVQIRFYQKEAPGLLRTLKDKYWHAACGTRQKSSVASVIMNRCNVNWHPWPQEVQVRIGSWLLDQIMACCDWFEVVTETTKSRRSNRLVPSQSLLLMKDEIMTQALAYSALTWPMLIEPNDWSPHRRGGYLLNELVTLCRLVRGASHDQVPNLIAGTPVDFVNRLQKVAYRVNTFVLDIAQELAVRGRGVGKFQPIEILPLPPKPVDIADNYDSRKSYRRAAAEVNNINALAFKKSVRTRAILDVAERFKDRDRFFLPWSFDYRGRAYPIPAFLHPHDTDFGKSLVRFADESLVTDKAEEWLAFQVGTTYGLDKEPVDVRVQWARNNHAYISAVATDPLASVGMWEAADEPWQFLAACEEYHACCIEKTRRKTGLPVAVDATCSGLQILAGLAKDATAASMVNVIPGERPRDAYAAVAEAARAHVPEAVRDHLDRKVVKRVVMTIPYNAKPHSNRIYIREALKEKGVELTQQELTETAKAVRKAVEEVLPGPMAVMEWIESTVGDILDTGVESIRWTSPSGFGVCQTLDKFKSKVINLQLMGRVRVSLEDGTEGPDRRRHRNSTSPNLIHSIDASLLHLAFHDFRDPFTVIHDSIWARATDMDKINRKIRETYCEVFRGDILKSWATEVQAVTTPPVIDDLNVEEVLDSTYFFS